MYKEQLSGRDLENHLDDCIEVVDLDGSLKNREPCAFGVIVGKMVARFARTFEQRDCELSDLT